MLMVIRIVFFQIFSQEVLGLLQKGFWHQDTAWQPAYTKKA
jgi:hypothetical protein